MQSSNVVKMVRYNGPNKNRRKNCLVTLRLNNELFFGIARCNIKADRYDKKVGMNLALGRATSSASNQGIPETAMYIDKSGLAGKCHVGNAKFLLRYFESLR